MLGTGGGCRQGRAAPEGVSQRRVEAVGFGTKPRHFTKPQISHACSYTLSRPLVLLPARCGFGVLFLVFRFPFGYEFCSLSFYVSILSHLSSPSIPSHSLFGKKKNKIKKNAQFHWERLYWKPVCFLSPPHLVGVPISGVSLDVQPHEGQVMEGQRLVLSCSVAAGTGSISFSWHREGSAEVLGRGTRYEIPSAQRDDDGHYYCVASNGGVPAQSPRLRVTVVGEWHQGDIAGRRRPRTGSQSWSQPQL